MSGSLLVRTSVMNMTAHYVSGEHGKAFGEREGDLR